MGGGRHGHQTGVADWVMAGLFSSNLKISTPDCKPMVNLAKLNCMKESINCSCQSDLKLNFDA